MLFLPSAKRSPGFNLNVVFPVELLGLDLLAERVGFDLVHGWHDPVIEASGP